MARKISDGIAGPDLCRFVVAGAVGSESGLCEVGNLIGANPCAAHRIEGFAVRETERDMSLRSWLLGQNKGHHKADEAINLAEELTLKMRERANQRDPFKAVLADLFFQAHDPALVADAFEISQEARIYKGPE
jgi:hypothetical protein